MSNMYTCMKSSAAEKLLSECDAILLYRTVSSDNLLSKQYFNVYLVDVLIWISLYTARYVYCKSFMTHYNVIMRKTEVSALITSSMKTTLRYFFHFLFTYIKKTLKTCMCYVVGYKWFVKCSIWRVMFKWIYLSNKCSKVKSKSTIFDSEMWHEL